MQRETLQAHLISEAFRTLLSEKHLYQSVQVDLTQIDKQAAEDHAEANRAACAPTIGGGGPRHVPPLHQINATARSPFVSESWCPEEGGSKFSPIGLMAPGPKNPFRLPTIRTHCVKCDAREPFNAVDVVTKPDKAGGGNQRFLVSYECQGCKGEPVQFLIRRRGEKLTLSGRDPMEKVHFPKTIPKTSSDHYSDAILAYQCGRELGGVFHLRVLIEQYWKGLPSVAEKVTNLDRATGDELGAAYKADLPCDFKQRFPNLHETYDEASAAIHKGKAEAGLFEKCRDQIERHFEALQMFKLSPIIAKKG